MKTNSKFENMSVSKWLYVGILLSGALGYILLSPKWAMPVFAWIAPACLLFYFRYATLRFRVGWFLLAMIISQMISSYDVAPFPLPILVIVSVISIVKMLLIFLLDRWIVRKNSHFVTTLIFPAAYVAKEFFDNSFSGGAWWSIANTQYTFSPLTQLASVTGLAGISFIIYWFAAVVVWCIQKYYNKENYRKGAWIYSGVFAVVLVFGVTRFYSNKIDNKSKVKIAVLPVQYYLLKNFKVMYIMKIFHRYENLYGFKRIAAGKYRTGSIY